MHKNFYASGFLYHLATEQILLQKAPTEEAFPQWSLFGGFNIKKETPEESFQRIVFQFLQIKISPKDIHPIYSYFHKTMGKNHHLFFAEVKTIKKLSYGKGLVSWFNKKQIPKLMLEDQVKHDITVGNRVIDAELRKSLGQQTL